MIQMIAPGEMYQRMRGHHVDLVDVRMPAAFRRLHVALSRNVPWRSFDLATFRDDRKASREPLYLICDDGSVSIELAERLETTGSHHVVIVDGGLKGWQAAGLPVFEGPKPISLEGQARIMIGLVLLITGLVGVQNDCQIAFIPTVIGVAMMISGWLDKTGLPALMAYLPWNRSLLRES